MNSKFVLDGELLKSDEINLSPSSLALAYGYGVFETIKFLERRPCFFREHLERLEIASQVSGLSHGFSREEVSLFVETLLGSSPFESGIFKIIVFRDADRSRVLLFIRSPQNTSPKQDLRLRVSDVVQPSEAFTTKHKTTNYVENWLQFQAAQNHGYDECLFLNEFGKVCECSMSNLFFRKNGILNTPHLDCGLLNGIVRSKVIQLCQEDGMIVNEGAFTLSEVLQGDAAYLTNSGMGIASVSEIDTGENSVLYEGGGRLLYRLNELYTALETKSRDNWKNGL